MEKQMAKLRKLCDPLTWPKDYLIFDGEVYSFVSDDPLEEVVCRILFRRFQ